MTKPLTFAKLALPLLLLAACGPSPGDKTAERPACADPAATARVNFHLVVDRDGVDPFPGADVMEDSGGQMVTVQRKVALSGRRIVRAAATFDQSGLPGVALQLDSQGADELAAVAAAHTGRRIALVVDGLLISAPRMDGPLHTRTVQFTGIMTPETATALAERINQVLPECVPPTPAKPSGAH